MHSISCLPSGSLQTTRDRQEETRRKSTMTAHNMDDMNTTQHYVQPEVSESSRYGPVRTLVGATDPPRVPTPNPVQVFQYTAREEENTLSVRNAVPNQDSVFALTRFLGFSMFISFQRGLRLRGVFSGFCLFYKLGMPLPPPAPPNP